MNETRGKNVAARPAKEIALMSVTTALLLAGQFALSAIQGVEVVTVILLTFCVSFGVKRGIFVATAFSVLRCIIFGFVPNVVILYLVYYNLFAVIFGIAGKLLANTRLWVKILVLAVLAAMMTACFTLLDDLITPWMYGYAAESAEIYFLMSLPVMGVQSACAVITVSLLWYPLSKAFAAVRL